MKALTQTSPWHRVLGLRGALVRYLRQMVQEPEQGLLLPVAAAGPAAGDAPTLLLLRDTLYQVHAADELTENVYFLLFIASCLCSYPRLD